MTMATNVVALDALGFTFLRRGNSVTVQSLNIQTLGERLREGYQRPAIFEPYKRSILELYAAAVHATSEESDLSADAKQRVCAVMPHAEDFLTNRPYRVPAPTVEVWDNGKVAFEWYERPDRIVTATIDELGRLAFAATEGGDRSTGMRVADGQWPVELIAWIKRVKG